MKVRVVVIILALFGALLYSTILSGFVVAERSATMPVETRAEDYYTLSFNSYMDLKKFYENHDFSFGVEKGLSWVICADIHKSSLFYTNNGITTFVIIPMLVKDRNTGEVRAISSNTMISISNIPNNIRLIISGFSSGTIMLNNVKGTVVIGGYVHVDVSMTAQIFWVFYATINVGHGVYGVRNTGISATHVGNITIVNYVADNSQDTMLMINGANTVNLEAVALASWVNMEGSAGIRIYNAKVVRVVDCGGAIITYNGDYENSYFGVYVRGYDNGLYLRNIGTFYINGSIDVGGWDGNRARTGIYADNVNRTVIGEISMKDIKGVLMDASFFFRLNYKRILYNVTENGTTTTSETDIISGGYYKMFGMVYFWNRWNGVVMMVGGDMNESLNLFSYRYQSHDYGINLADINTEHSVSVKDVYCIGTQVSYDKGTPVNWTNTSLAYHDFTYLVMWDYWHDEDNPFTFNIGGEEAKLRFYYNYREVGAVYSLLDVYLNDVNFGYNMTSTHNDTTNLTVITYTYNWTGVLSAKAYYTGPAGDSAGDLDVVKAKYGLGVPDNGDKEKDIVSLFNSSEVTLINVTHPVGFNLQAPSQGAPIDVFFPYLSLSLLMTVLIGFAFVRWGYSVVTSGDSPEEVARNKQLLKQILIGGVIIFFVMYNFGILLNIFSFP